MKIVSLGIAEDGSLESALGASLRPSYRLSSDSGAQSGAETYPNPQEFVPFVASSSPSRIPGNKSTHVSDPPLACRTGFETLTRDNYVHTRTMESPLTSGALWSQPNVFVNEDRGLCSFSSFPEAG